MEKNKLERELIKYFKNEEKALNFPKGKDVLPFATEKDVSKKRIYILGYIAFSIIVVSISIVSWNPIGQGNLFIPKTPQGDIHLEKPETSQEKNAPNNRNLPKPNTSLGGDTEKTVNNDDLSIYTLSEWRRNNKVIWDNTNNLKGNNASGKTIPKGTIYITKTLQNVMKKHNNDDIFAVMVDFSSSIPDKELGNWKYEGRMISEMEKEFRNSNSKELAVKINQAKHDYYLNYIGKFKNSFANAGMGIYLAGNGQLLTSNQIFYTFATKAKLLDFKCKDSEAFIFNLAYRFK